MKSYNILLYCLLAFNVYAQDNINEMTWQNVDSKNIGGRCRALIIDKDNASIMYAGGVSGGLFVSYDGGKYWMPHAFNQEANYPGISAMTQASNGDIYIATGEAYGVTFDGTPNSQFTAPFQYGCGIYKSSDGGVSFQLLSSTKPDSSNYKNDSWSLIYDIEVNPTDPNKVYVATHKGIKYSFDGGTIWEDPLGIRPAHIDRSCYDIHISGNTIHTSISNNYYQSKDGFTFEDRTGLNGYYNESLISFFAASSQDTNYVYSVTLRYNEFYGVLQSKDNGASWETIARRLAPDYFDPIGFNGIWNVALAVNPKDKGHLVVGGSLELWDWKPTQGWKRKVATSGGSTFKYHHKIVFNPLITSHVYVANSFGIFQTNKFNALYPEFKPINKGFYTSHLFNVDASSENMVVTGGIDNGSLKWEISDINEPEIQLMEQSRYEGYSKISTLNNNYIFISNYGGVIKRSEDKGETFNCVFDQYIDPNRDCRVETSTYLTDFHLAELSDTTETYSSDTTLVSGNEVFVTTSRIKSIKKFSFLFTSRLSNLFFTPDATSSLSPRWFSLSGYVGSITSLAANSNFSKIFIGNQRGDIYLLEGFNNKVKIIDSTITISRDTIIELGKTYFITYIDSTENYVSDFPDNATISGWSWSLADSSYFGLNARRINKTSAFSGVNRYITSLTLNPTNEDELYVTLGQYGNTDYFYKLGATASDSFNCVSIQNGLPQYPLYDFLIDKYNNNNYLLASDVGIFSSDNKGSNWLYQKENFPHVPVFSLEQKPLYSEACYAVFAATFGRGLLYSTSLLPLSINCKRSIATNIDELIVTDKIDNVEVKLYPNPVSGKELFISIYSVESGTVAISFFDLTGKLFQELNQEHSIQRGNNSFMLEINNVPNGMYLTRVVLNDKSYISRIMVVK